MNKIIKDKKNKIKKIEILSILIIYTLFTIFITKFILGDDDISYSSTLKNGYYIEYTSSKGLFLKNRNKYYKYPENFPRNGIIKSFNNDEVFMLLDKREEYYIVFLDKDLIYGPFTREKFLETIKEMEYYELLHWEYA